MQIVKHSELVEHVRYHRFFERLSCPGSDFAFDCDEQGNAVGDEYASADTRAARVAELLIDPDLADRGVRVERWTYREPAVGLCQCGREVTLDGFTNTCDCGRDYNSGGQLLAPRCQWGEETGESLADILSIP